MRRFVPLLFLTVAGSVLVGCGAAAEPQTVAVSAVVDGDTLVVETETGSERVRLIGVDTPEIGSRTGAPEPYAGQAKAFTARLADGRRVRLEGDSIASDRDAFDRLLRYVYLPDGRSLNELILSEGYGHAYTRHGFDRIDRFRDLEVRARREGAGVWDPDRVPTIPLADLRNHRGETVTTCGPVGSARYIATLDGKPTFVNLGRAYPEQDLTVVIWGTDRGAFGAPESTFRDREICVTGKLTSHRGRPQIEVRHPSQIERIE